MCGTLMRRHGVQSYSQRFGELGKHIEFMCTLLAETRKMKSLEAMTSMEAISNVGKEIMQADHIVVRTASPARTASMQRRSSVMAAYAGTVAAPCFPCAACNPHSVKGTRTRRLWRGVGLMYPSSSDDSVSTRIETISVPVCTRSYWMVQTGRRAGSVDCMVRRGESARSAERI